MSIEQTVSYQVSCDTCPAFYSRNFLCDETGTVVVNFRSKEEAERVALQRGWVASGTTEWTCPNCVHKEEEEE